jgi:hypothetical protein
MADSHDYAADAYAGDTSADWNGYGNDNASQEHPQDWAQDTQSWVQQAENGTSSSGASPVEPPEKVAQLLKPIFNSISHWSGGDSVVDRLLLYVPFSCQRPLYGQLLLPFSLGFLPLSGYCHSSFT